MRIVIVLIFISFIQFSLFSQKIYRATEGGGELVKIDTLTPLPDLIKRLDAPWDFVETGKGYWIGYTDDMFSIACYKDSAIQPLVALMEITESKHTKIGVLYTLHLIGIRSDFAGRFREKFVDTLARKSIINQLSDSSLNETVLFLLMRDPWISDVPYLMEYLTHPHFNYLEILSMLQRYPIEDKPFGQKVPDSIVNMEVKISPYLRSPEYDLIKIKETLGDKVKVDEEILNSDNWKDGLKSVKKRPVSLVNVDIGELINSLTNSRSSYIDFCNIYPYIYENNRFYFNGPVKVREIWLNWWKDKNDKK